MPMFSRRHQRSGRHVRGHVTGIVRVMTGYPAGWRTFAASWAQGRGSHRLQRWPQRHGAGRYTHTEPQQGSNQNSAQSITELSQIAPSQIAPSQITPQQAASGCAVLNMDLTLAIKAPEDFIYIQTGRQHTNTLTQCSLPFRKIHRTIEPLATGPHHPVVPLSDRRWALSRKSARLGNTASF